MSYSTYQTTTDIRLLEENPVGWVKPGMILIPQPPNFFAQKPPATVKWLVLDVTPVYEQAYIGYEWIIKVMTISGVPMEVQVSRSDHNNFIIWFDPYEQP